MEITLAQLTDSGPVRDHNEDFIEQWKPAEPDEMLERGAVSILCDGVGGHNHGEVASRMAVEAALKKFKDAKPGTPARQLVQDMFDAANLAIFDKRMADGGHNKMATTMSLSLFRNNEVTIGHIGDCRVYLIRNGQIKVLTDDHSYVGMQLKMGLITEEEAMQSDMRNMITRTVGQDMTINPDRPTVTVNKGDIIVQCSDGLHGSITKEELCNEIELFPKLEDACHRLIALAIKRGTTDNVSVQLIRIESVVHVAYYKGQPYYVTLPEPPKGHEVGPGSVIDGRFSVTELVARSGMASIFKAIDATTNEIVALKIPFMQYESDPAFFGRFQREEEIGKLMNHPNLLRIIPVENKSRPYIVMEFLEGQTLGNLLKTIKPLPVHDAVTIAARLADALDYMHRRRENIIHRDMKPENVMICNDGSLRIMDFGIAKGSGLKKITMAGFSPSMGTPDYMAPEQVKGQRGDERTDIYSLGAMLYEMATGRAPFEGSNAYAVMNARLLGDPLAPRSLNSKITPEIEEIILHAMARKPDDRYSCVAEMKEELIHLDKVKVTGRAERLQPPVQQKPESGFNTMLLWMLLVPVAIIILFFVFLRPPVRAGNSRIETAPTPSTK
jgi:serine/threonine protein phosphatase PrpC